MFHSLLPYNTSPRFSFHWDVHTKGRCNNTFSAAGLFTSAHRLCLFYCVMITSSFIQSFCIMHQRRQWLSLLFIRTCVEFVLRCFALLISTQRDHSGSVFSPRTETVECRCPCNFFTCFCRMGAVVALQGNGVTLPTTAWGAPLHGQRRWRPS
jgi:hypothetical protein